MSKKSKKPPIDETSIRERLERARTESPHVWISRWIPNADTIRGFVVAHGETWILLATHIGGARPDGWTLLRVRDIQSVQFDVDEDRFELKVLKLRGQWPPALPETEIDLDDTVRAIRSAVAAAGPLAAVHAEFRDPDVCWIGSVLSTDDGQLKLREIGVSGEWLKKPRKFDLDDVTRFDVGDDYMAALQLVSEG